MGKEKLVYLPFKRRAAEARKARYPLRNKMLFQQSQRLREKDNEKVAEFRRRA
jgi:hypothetical protein